MASLTCRLRPSLTLAYGLRRVASSPLLLDQTGLASSAQDYLYRERYGRRAPVERLRSMNLPKIEMTEEQRAMMFQVKDCMSDSDWEGAMKVFQEVPEEVDQSWQPVLRVILNCLCKSMRYREAAQVFERFPGRDTLAYNMYLNLLARLKHSHDFGRTLQRMEDENIPQSSVTICAIMSMCKESNDWAQALQLLDGLKSDTEAEASIDVPYLLAMTACARARAKDQAQTLLEEAKQRPDFRLRSSHYNALIVACGTDTEAAREAFEQLKAEGLETQGSDWRALMSAHREKLQEQRAVYQEFRQQAPSEAVEEALAILLRGAVMQDDSEAVTWVLEEMKSQGCEVDSDQALAVPSLRRAIRDLQEWQMSQKLSKPAAAPAAAAAPSDDAGLPDGWQSTLDPSSGQRYYWNVGDPAGTTTWERPT